MKTKSDFYIIYQQRLMTFYVPPVFLFGNNANRVPHDEEKKSEYKTAAETEIKVENWRVKRIAELEEENKKLKEYNGELIENHKKDIAILCEENKKLKETNMDLNSALMVSSAEIVRLKEELKELKEKLNKAGLEEYGFFNEY